MIKTLLIANRGEIACRIMRTAHRLGIATVAVYSDADAHAPHVRLAGQAVRLGPAPARESYLKADLILEAARQTGADAIHPGYGFLSENADFARACQKAGIVFVGPDPDSIEAMGLKDRAKALMEKAGVPVTPGYHGADQDPEFLAREAGKIGYPVLIKAVAGGGGKGMRKVEAPGDFAEALASCQREAASSFGDDRVLIEKFIASPRHIEVQVFGDRRGRVVHFFERDCSLQRRHQKVIEEAPAPGMTPNVRAAMCSAAVRAAEAVNYVGAGTVEFIVDGSGPLREDGFYFMEMNTRLQVEHPVTEAITGYDLVELQLRVAAGGPAPEQDRIAIRGWAMEARLYAEDPASGFLPSIGRLDRLTLPGDPEGVRADSGVEEGGEVSLHYDPMIAKLITHGGTREEAIDVLVAGLDARTRVWPVRTNAGFLRRALTHPDFRAGRVDTRFIDQRLDALAPQSPPALSLIAGALALADGGPLAALARDPWDVRDGFRANGAPVIEAGLDHAGARLAVRLSYAEGRLEAAVGGETLTLDGPRFEPGLFTARLDGQPVSARFEMWPGGGALVSAQGETHLVTPYNAAAQAEGLEGGGAVLAPMPGKVLSVAVKPGDAVKKGQTLVVLEAMKMEHALAAPRDGVVEAVNAETGAQVSDGAALVVLSEAEG
ncbi:acetyl/propionyl/methylcrotonyl-CoA carboxylase subunit alpha [Alkalicaulis satelles]|uniref:Acetyl/propionyl/methylcrotonyl-CoA carboxylase subunit alpha n=1 Tax=Alkalicaulis satelles TaxID=2609175 RepID=A0A5M6ZRI3_9PROT|nr:acetyl/propionyl/methylcrotonyl-CoA carboxylase subunit alpha [Alkalicaulis satelles]KAA5804891.1 acetyl/propionyl/methylcrotonyl-CoA carboxylase subunit alpha [Alkalicaulis satelles]